MSIKSPIGILFSLPRELRDMVYVEVLEECTEAPRAPSDDADQREENQGWGTIYYQRDLARPNVEGLLRCCRQIRDEVSELRINCFFI